MDKTVSQIKHFIFSLDLEKVRLLATLASIAVGVVVANSPGAGSGIGG